MAGPGREHRKKESAKSPPEGHEEGKRLRHRERVVLDFDRTAGKLSGAALPEGQEADRQTERDHAHGNRKQDKAITGPLTRMNHSLDGEGGSGVSRWRWPGARCNVRTQTALCVGRTGSGDYEAQHNAAAAHLDHEDERGD